MKDDVLFHSIADLGELLRTRQLSPVELLNLSLRRIEALNPRLHAFITVVQDEALRQARDAEREIQQGAWRGPLHGIPFGTKDIYFTQGVRTTLASPVFADFVPDHDAAVVTRLRDAGAILIGKTNMVPVAWGPSDYYFPEYGVTWNPWKLDRFSGGSSNGSAIGVATGMIPLGMGGDGGGSIRNPASFCGVAGLKPTFGLVSRYGVWLNSPSAETLGPLARTAEDCAIALQAVAGYDQRDAYSVDRPVPDYRAALGHDIKGLRIGLHRTHFFEDLQPAVEQAIMGTVDTFRNLGASVQEVEVPGLLDDARRWTVIHAEAAVAHRRHLEERPEAYVPDTRASLQTGLEMRAVDYLEGIQAFRRLRVKFEQVFREVDLLLMPTRDTVAPRIAEDGRVLEKFPYEKAGRPSLTVPFNLGGQPAISIPCGFDDDGLPVGLQLAGRLFDDAGVLRAAHAYQQVTDWHRSRPPVVENLAGAVPSGGGVA